MYFNAILTGSCYYTCAPQIISLHAAKVKVMAKTINKYMRIYVYDLLKTIIIHVALEIIFFV